ncbi:MAG: M23 family metallopeptidase [Microbacteriaceae bacterium]|nr:M23 family metallopeptidase [Microbacteriaceae bacterium]
MFPRRDRVVIAVVVGALVGGLMANSSASALEYPSWEEVLVARASEASTQTLLATIQGQLQNLTEETDRATALAQTRGREFEAADDAFQNAAFKAGRLRDQAVAADKTAAASRAAAGQMISYRARAGGPDLTAVLLTRDQDAAELLDRLEFTSKVTDASSSIFTKATQDGNLARSRTQQAQRVTIETERLKTIATSALQQAQAASDAAAAALLAQNQASTELTAQLAVLTSERTTAEADYAFGVAARAAAQAAADAAQAASRPGPAGVVSAVGWANPTVGALVSPYGFRIHPITGGYRLHAGIDLAGGCNQPIYATSAGRVVFSGDNGGYGNYIMIQHEGGALSAYAHIIDGGRLVQLGQTVTAGQMIARTGNTGASTGCHLHFEIRTSGTAIDPVPFLQQRGVSVG